MKNNGHGETNSSCYFHPREVVVGICALCLKERLLLFLASKQGHHLPSPANESKRPFAKVFKSKSIFALVPRVFASGSNFVHHHGNSDILNDQISIDEDFISIKIGDDGKATWSSSKKTVVVEPLAIARAGITGNKESCDDELGMLTVERSSPDSKGVRWRKRIGQLLLHVGLWKRSGEASACHVGLGGKVEELKKKKKGRRGWIRSLTRRRRTTNGN